MASSPATFSLTHASSRHDTKSDLRRDRDVNIEALTADIGCDWVIARTRPTSFPRSGSAHLDHVVPTVRTVQYQSCNHARSLFADAPYRSMCEARIGFDHTVQTQEDGTFMLRDAHLDATGHTDSLHSIYTVHLRCKIRRSPRHNH